MYKAWICEGCGSPQKFKDHIWNCLGCGKEICDSCVWMYGTCKPCCEHTSEQELSLRFEKES